MKIKNTRNILKTRMQEAKKRLETYEMQKDFLRMAESRAFAVKKSNIAALAQARARGIEASAMWERGLIAGYKASLILVK